MIRPSMWRVPFAALTVPMRGPVGLGTSEGWDAMRQTAGFAMPSTREAWQAAAASDPDLPGRASAIASLVRDLGAGSVCSYAAGTGQLEWLLHERIPDVTITCTDFAPDTVETLRGFFPEASVVLHDLRVDDAVPADLALLYRAETELADRQWPTVYARLETALVVPSDFLRFGLLFRRPHGELVGYMRTRRGLTRLWAGSHTSRPVKVADLEGFLLT